MNDDDLEQALLALREEGERPAPQAKTTKARILRDLAPRKRKLRSVWLIPLAAILAGGTVLAATGRLPAVASMAAQALGIAPRATVAPPVSRPAKAVAAKVEQPRPEVTAAPPSPVEEVPVPAVSLPSVAEAPSVAARADVPSAAPRKVARAEASAPRAADRTEDAPSVATSAPAVEAPSPGAAPPAPEKEDTAIALYRTARKLHFVDQNPAAALRAWEAYLAADPSGPLSVDARYDRALCLVRLGRTAEAKTALAPFAAGKFGSYRQSEAKALLDAMPASH
ncbi:MAG TPA: tetratricopeptide repeat protein [Polyangiaceae bacterium]|nr:tetratricopeptide repeat protein [Polyangiaceae bacterium]